MELARVGVRLGRVRRGYSRVFAYIGWRLAPVAQRAIDGKQTPSIDEYRYGPIPPEGGDESEDENR